MSRGFVAFTGCLVFFCFGFAIYWVTSALLGQKIKKLACLGYCLYYCAVQWVVNLSMASVGMVETGLWYHFGVFTLHAVVVSVLLYKLFRLPLLQIFSAAALSNFITATVGSVAEKAAVTYTPVFENPYLYVFCTIVLPYLIILLAVGLLALVLRKVNFCDYFSSMFTSPGRSATALIVCSVLMHSWALLDWLFPSTEPNAQYAMFFLALIAVALLGIQFMAMYAAGQDKIKAQEETISRQQAHMELLEELQQEIRAFRHDFTNLFSGLSLQAQEGDLAGIRDFMRETSNYFDEKLGSEIQQMDGLSNIRPYPLRSLLTTKLSALRKSRIRAELEVLRPVTGGQMPAADLLRCLGILLDNAAEAAGDQGGQVRVVLLQEERELYIAVANNYTALPDLALLTRQGYTTKGSGRGTGLASYRKMVARSPGCVMRTYLKDDYFVQELRIPAA